MPKLVYCWRSTPAEFLVEASQFYSQQLREILRWIVVGSGPRFGDFQYHLSSLPVHLGGLGNTLPADMQHYSFLLSMVQTQQLQQAIFPALKDFSPIIDPLVQDFLSQLTPTEVITASKLL
jgi:hypothetical protein